MLAFWAGSDAQLLLSLALRSSTLMLLRLVQVLECTVA